MPRSIFVSVLTLCPLYAPVSWSFILPPSRRYKKKQAVTDDVSLLLEVPVEMRMGGQDNVQLGGIERGTRNA